MAINTFFANQLYRLGNLLLGKTLATGTRVFSVSAPEVYAEMDAKTSITDGYNSNAAVYSIVSKDIKKFASLPRYLYDKRVSEQKALPGVNPLIMERKAAKRFTGNNKLSALLQRPNQYQGQDAFLATVRAYYKVCGEAFIWLNRGDIDQYRLPDGSFDDMKINRLPVVEMVPLPADYITVIPDPYNMWGVLGYVLETGERVVIRKDDVIHWKNTNLSFDAAARTHLRGMPPLKPGSKTLEENNSMAKAAMRQAQNNGAFGALFNESLDKFSPTQQSELKRVIDAKINNNDISGQVATLQGKWGFLDFGRSAKDMMLIEGQKFSWQELCFLFGVPVELFDPTTTFANKEMAQVGWVINEIMPDCKQLDDEMNRVLLKAFNLESAVYIGTDYTQSPEVQKDMANTAKVLQEIWAITPDEVREFLNYERKGGEFDEPWVPTTRTPMSQMNDGGNDILNALQNDRSADMGNSVA